MAEGRAAGPYREAEPAGVLASEVAEGSGASPRTAAAGEASRRNFGTLPDLGALEREHGLSRRVTDAWLGLAVAASLAGAFGLGPWGLALPAFGGAGLIVAFGAVLGARGMLPLPGALRVRVHEHGVVVLRRSGRSTELRYREVVSLVSSTVSGREDVMQTHVVRDAHGREVVLTHQIERCSELADTIRKRSWPSRLAAPQAAIERADMVAFGRASLSSSAIIVEGKRPLAFAEVDDVTAADDVVRITRRDPTLRDPVVWTRLAYGELPDADVFIELARARIAAAR